MLEQVLQTSDDELADILPSTDPDRSVATAPSVTLGEVAREYIAVKEPSWGAQSARTARSIVERQLIGNLGHRRVDELMGLEIQMLITDIVRKYASMSLLRKIVGNLRAILDLAHERNVIAHNPMRGCTIKFEYESHKPRSDRHLSVEECRALLSALSGRDQLIVRMFL